MALTLSQCNGEVRFGGQPNSRRRFRIQQTLAITFATPLYLALDRETVVYRLEHHESKLSSRKIEQSDVERSDTPLPMVIFSGCATSMNITVKAYILIVHKNIKYQDYITPKYLTSSHVSLQIFNVPKSSDKTQLIQKGDAIKPTHELPHSTSMIIHVLKIRQRRIVAEFYRFGLHIPLKS